MYKKDSDTYDIYLLPPGEDVETCTSWLRMRNRDGRYNLMFEEWVTDGPFIISPRITFEVSLADTLLPMSGTLVQGSESDMGGLSLAVSAQGASGTPITCTSESLGPCRRRQPHYVCCELQPDPELGT